MTLTAAEDYRDTPQDRLPVTVNHVLTGGDAAYLATGSARAPGGDPGQRSRAAALFDGSTCGGRGPKPAPTAWCWHHNRARRSWCDAVGALSVQGGLPGG
ncbi:MAG: hypothetical protein R2838_10400 [Caldilineaceae bacterium]